MHDSLEHVTKWKFVFKIFEQNKMAPPLEKAIFLISL